MDECLDRRKGRRTDRQTRVYMPLSFSRYPLPFFFLLSSIHPSSIHHSSIHSFFPPPLTSLSSPPLPPARKPQTANGITPWTPSFQIKSCHITSHQIKSNHQHNKEKSTTVLHRQSLGLRPPPNMYNAPNARVVRVRVLLVGEWRVRSCDYVYVDRLID